MNFNIERTQKIIHFFYYVYESDYKIDEKILNFILGKKRRRKLFFVLFLERKLF